MNPKKTLLILVLFAVVLGLYFWDTDRVEKKAEVEKEQGRLVLPPKDKLTEISLAGEAGETALIKQGEDWRLTQPLALLTEKAAIDQLLTQIDTATRESAFDADAGKLADYGLDKPALTATIKAEDEGYSEAIQVGTATSDGSGYYAKLASSPSVFTVTPALREALARGQNDLRDKRTLPLDITQATTVTMVYGGQTVHLAKDGEAWRMTEPFPSEGDNEKINAILRTWNNAKAADFEDTDTLQTAVLVRHGLSEPGWVGTVLVPREGDSPASGTLFLAAVAPQAEDEAADFGGGAPGGRTPALAEGGTYFFTVENSLAHTLRPTLDDLRNKQLFKLKPADVGRIELKARENQVLLERTPGGTWQFADDPGASVDQGQVSAKLAELLNLKATHFIDGPTTSSVTSLENPYLTAVITSVDGSTTEGLTTGAKDKRGGTDFVYAQLLGSGRIVGVDWTKPGSLMLTREDLIDKRLLDFDVEAVQQIKIHDGPLLMAYRRTASGAWDGETSGTALTARPQQANTLLYALASLKWKEKLDPTQESGQTLIKTQNLEEPARRIELLTDNGDLLAEFGQGGETDRMVYVRRGTNEYFGIDRLNFATAVEALNGLLGSGGPGQ